MNEGKGRVAPLARLWEFTEVYSEFREVMEQT